MLRTVCPGISYEQGLPRESCNQRQLFPVEGENRWSGAKFKSVEHLLFPSNIIQIKNRMKIEGIIMLGGVSCGAFFFFSPTVRYNEDLRHNSLRRYFT